MTTSPPHVLLLDDGELEDVVDHLRSLDVAFTRLSGGEISEEQAPPLSLLVATPRRAPSVRRGSPAGAKPGRPVRIIVVEEDSNAMRRMLRRMGFHLLVRRPTHPEVWRLLIQRALFQGEERRSELRVPVGSEVALHHGSESQHAIMVDLSSRGCRLLGEKAFEAGASRSVEIPARATGGEPLVLRGTLERTHHDPDARCSESYDAALVFDADLDEKERLRLNRLIGSWSNGASLCEADARDHSSSGPAVEVELRATGDDDATGRERRQHTRGSFQETVEVEGLEESRVLMGRDLSAGGMRVERLTGLGVGDEFSLAIYGPSRAEPFTVEASVLRDDGDDSLALAFRNVAEDVAAELEKLVACLPDVESLEESETEGLGSVITEIVATPDRQR